MTERLGLTDKEVEYLQSYSDEEWPAKLIAQYNMVVAAPQDQAARGIFTSMLNDWRHQPDYLGAKP